MILKELTEAFNDPEVQELTLLDYLKNDIDSYFEDDNGREQLAELAEYITSNLNNTSR